MSISVRKSKFSHILAICNFRLGGSEQDVKEIIAHPFFKTVNWQDLIEKKVSVFVWSVFCVRVLFYQKYKLKDKLLFKLIFTKISGEKQRRGGGGI